MTPRKRIFITGSSDGLGLMAAQELIADGHGVTLHARNRKRAADALAAAPGAEGVITGDLASMKQTRVLADSANELGPFDAVVHNAGIGYREPHRIETEDGLAHVFQINVLAVYLLTALVTPPQRLVYLGSGLHLSGNPDLSDLQWQRREWDGLQAYADSKLFDVVLAFAVARRWRRVRVNACEPGWVPTKMGGPDALDDLALGARTQTWLAASDDPEVGASGGYFYHQQPQEMHPAVTDVTLQDGLVNACAELTGVALPIHNEVSK